MGITEKINARNRTQKIVDEMSGVIIDNIDNEHYTLRQFLKDVGIYMDCKIARSSFYYKMIVKKVRDNYDNSN